MDTKGFVPVWESKSPPRPITLMQAQSWQDSVQCWCGSPQPYRVCHKGRGAHPRVRRYDVSVEQKKRDSRNRCLAEAGSVRCAELAIGSHLISREAFIAPIATDRHVYGIDYDLERGLKRTGQRSPWLTKIGVNRASVFPGFCEQHDHDLFRCLDIGPRLIGYREAVAIAYRTLSRGIHIRARALRDADLVKKSDAGKQLEQQVAEQNMLNEHLHGFWLGIQDGRQRKTQLEMLLSDASEQKVFEYQVVQFDRVLPVVSCAPFSCEVDFMRRKAGDGLMIREGNVPLMLHALIPVGGRSTYVMAWLADGFEDVYRGVAESVQEVPLARVSSAVCRFMVDTSENFLLSPTWYDGLSELEMLSLDNNLHKVAGIPHGHDCTFDSPELTIPGRVEAMFRSWQD